MKARSFAVLLVVVAVAACSPQGSDQSAELGAMAGSWWEALNAGDLDGLASLYTADCTVMPPNAEIVNGSAGAKAAFAEMIDDGLTGGLDTIAVAASGGIGYHTATYWLQTPDGTVIDRGKFIETWRKEGGEWKIANDIWNSDWAPGASLTTVLITLDVEDAAHWIGAFQGPGSRKELFAKNGVANVRVFQNPDKVKSVALLVDATDLEAFQAFVASPESTTAKAEDGVIEASLRMLAEVN